MEGKKTNNSKVLWYILFAFVTVVMCYLFVVVYFYFISPYNISLKLALWPFVPEQNIGEMYLDATVDVTFSGTDIYTLDEVDKDVVGINVRVDGFVIAPYDEFKSCTNLSEIKIRTNDGTIYDGKLLFSDTNFNLAILKCENVDEEKKVRIPYVNVIDVSNVIHADTEVLAVASPLQTKTVWDGTIVNPEVSDVYKTIEVSNTLAVDFVIENCYSVQLQNSDVEFTGGAVFDKSGNILGLSYKETLSDGSHVIMPIDGANLFLNDVIESYRKNEAYRNDLVKSFVGFDQVELKCFQYVSAENVNESAKNTFYFDNSFPGYTDNIIRFGNSGLSAYFLFKDFVWKGETILEKDSVITAMKVGRKIYFVYDKTDLLEVLYNAQENERLTIYYYNIDTLGQEILSVSVKI